jgi:tRNA 2-selenouridine synthase
VSLQTLSAERALESLDTFSTIIDARSPGEYAEDHLPGAVNWPTLDDAQRQQIGTDYKQVNAFEAKKRGAAMAARNIAGHIERELLHQPKEWAPLLYCWRGGKRSGSLGLVLDQIGFRVSLIEGGYKAFRTAVLADLPKQVQRLRFQVICGTTGSGKTRLLQALSELGAQVLDLEALACHRSSVLGLLPGQPQPSQKAFDTRIWNALRQFDPARVVYVESESKKVGNVAVPESLISAMRASACLRLILPDPYRVQLLLEDYEFFVRDTEFFCERLDTLVQVRGGPLVRQWQALARAGRTPEVVQDLLAQHYDPSYLQSMQRNFVQYPAAVTFTAHNPSHEALKDVARQILATGS